MKVGNDKVVSMFYELKDAKTNEIIDTNIGDQVLEFIYGKNQIIPGLEQALEGLQEGDKKDNILIKPEDAYGVYQEDAIQVLPLEQFAGVDLKKDMTLFGQGEDGSQVQVIVKDFDDKEVTVDFNHPLAGVELLFSIEIDKIRDADEDELSSGMVGGHSCGSHSGGCCGGSGHGHGDEGGCCH